MRKKIYISFCKFASAVITVVGVLSSAVAVLGLLVSISDGITGEDVSMVIFFGICGVLLIYWAWTVKKTAENIKLYLSIIVNSDLISLDEIARVSGKKYPVVKKSVQRLIDKDFLPNAYINEVTREVVIAQSEQASNEPLDNDSIPVQAKIVNCRCCGANNKIIGDIGECKYCGSYIK